MKSIHWAFLAQVTLLTPLALVTNVVICVDVDADELLSPPPPQATKITAEVIIKLKAKPILL